MNLRYWKVFSSLFLDLFPIPADNTTKTALKYKLLKYSFNLRKLSPKNHIPRMLDTSPLNPGKCPLKDLYPLSPPLLPPPAAPEVQDFEDMLN